MKPEILLAKIAEQFKGNQRKLLNMRELTLVTLLAKEGYLTEFGALGGKIADNTFELTGKANKFLQA